MGRRRHHNTHHIARTSIRRRPRRQRAHDEAKDAADGAVGRYYEPITVDKGAARRGVALRLYSAVAALVVVMACVSLLLLTSPEGFALAALVFFGLGALSMAVAMLLSARREELVHQLAHDMHHQMLLTHERHEAAKDGTLG